jgi:putative Holliday junction resolvase
MVPSGTMKIIPSQDFKRTLPPNAKLLGLDVGSKTIGLAFGDMATRVCTPLKVINRVKLKADTLVLAKIVSEYGISGLVVGWPLNADGTEGKRCQATRDTMLAMAEFLPDMAMTFWDERFTTRNAESFLINEIDMSRKKRDQVIDKMAALHILQDFLG